MRGRAGHIGRLLGVMSVLALLSLGLTAPLAAQAQEQPAAEVHVVQPGETLYRIARNNGLTVEELKRLNGLTSNLIEVGQRLVIRPAPTPPVPPPQVEPPEPEPTLNPDTTAEADTIVEAPDTTLAQPDTMGGPDPGTFEEPDVSNAEALDAEEADEAADTEGDEPARPAYGRYEVQPGDTYLTIAARYGVPADSLWLLNDRSTAPLEPGQGLRLPARFATAEHRVRRGDTLARIARRYGTTITAIRRLNDLRGDQIRIDQVLEVPFGEPPPVRDEADLPPAEVRGAVTIYPDTFAGRLMANGDPYDPDRYTVSHPSLPLGTLVYLTDPATERSTLAEVTDRGPLDASFIMDVSVAVAAHLGLEDGDRVQVRVLGR